MVKRTHQTADEIMKIVTRAAELFNEQMGFGTVSMSRILEQSQAETTPEDRRRQINSAAVAKYQPLIRRIAGELREKIAKEKQEQEEKAKEELKEPTNGHRTLFMEEPPVPPTRMGLDPKFAASIVYAMECFTRTFAEHFGQTLGKEIGIHVGKNVRDAIYDVRHMMGTPRDYEPKAPPVPVADPAPEVKATPDLLAKFKKPKLLVLGLNADQQQAVRKKLPGADWRFVEHMKPGVGGAALKQMGTLAKTCDAVFIMTKFVAHAIERQLDGIEAKKIRVNGVTSELCRVAVLHFQQLAPKTAGEKNVAAHVTETN